MAKTTLIGSLKISLLAVTKGYEKGLGRAARSTKKFSRLMRMNLGSAAGLALGKLTALGLKGFGSIPGLVVTAVKALLKLVKVLAITLVAAAAAATAALVLLARSSFKSLDRIAKSSRIIGIAVSELQAFEQAAGEAGVETKVLEKSLRNMTRQVHDAAKGTGEAIDALRDLQLDAKKLAALSIPEQFIAIADALADIKSEGERIQLASDLFGARGLSLLNLSTKSLKEIDRFLESIGAKISDFDARKIEASNDAVSKLKLSFKALGDQIAIRVAPFIEGVVKRIVAFIQGLGGVAEIMQNLISRASALTISGINRIGEAFESVVKFMRDSSGTIAGVFSKIVGGAFSTAEFIVNAFGVMEGGLQAIWASIKATYFTTLFAISFATLETVKGVIALLNKIPGIDLKVPETLVAFVDILEVDFIDATTDAVKKMTAVLTTGLDNSFIKIGLKIGILGEEAKEKIESIGVASTATFTAMAAHIEALGPLGEELAAFLERIRSDFVDLGDAAKRAGIDVEDFAETTGEAAQQTSDVANILKNTVGSAADGIVSSLRRGENAFISLRDVAIRMLDDIAAALIKGALFRALASLFGGGGGLLATAFPSTAARAAIPAARGLVPAFAGSGGGARGGDVHINFFGPTSGDDAIKAAVRDGINEAQPALTNASVGAVREKVQRDPRYRDAFR